MLVSLVAVALGRVRRHPSDLQAGAPQVQRLIFASAGFDESNRFWMVARPDHLQYDPFLETLLEVDPKTGEYTPPGREVVSQPRLQGVDVLSCARVCSSTSGTASSPPRTSCIPTPS